MLARFRRLPRFYLETTQQQNGLKKWLQARVVGLPLAWSRILGFNVVKATRGVLWIPSEFVQISGERPLRTQEHIANNPRYPDPIYYVSLIGKYLLRNRKLAHLRIEQSNRYFVLKDDRADRNSTNETLEDTITDQAYPKISDPEHRNWCPEMDAVSPGTAFRSAFPGLPVAHRRLDGHLGVSRTAFLEPLGEKREGFYEQKLLTSLAWFAPSAPQLLHVAGKEVVSWTIRWCPPSPDRVENVIFEPVEMNISGEPAAFSFEQKCRDLENTFADPELNLVCRCCAGQTGNPICNACTNGVGWHYCACDGSTPENRQLRWKPGSLHGGKLDIQRVLYNMHRRNVPLNVIEDKALTYASTTPPLIPVDMAKAILDIIRLERGPAPIVNDGTGGVQDVGGGSDPGISTSRKLSQQGLEELLVQRERLMQSGGAPGVATDQFRVYDCIKRAVLDENAPKLRMMVQASAGTGKSFVLTTVFLLCLVHRIKCKAAAPTGIAAANIDLEGTDVGATTLHSHIGAN